MAKKQIRRKKAKNNNSLITVFIIIIILAIISVITAYFLVDDKDKFIPDFIEQVSNSDTEIVATDPEIKENIVQEIKTPIEGTWVSNYDGAMLTITGGTFNVDMPSVDASAEASGTIAVENTIVTFINKTGNKSCQNVEGHYNYSFVGDELKLSLIKDPCEARVRKMAETWFKL